MRAGSEPDYPRIKLGVSACLLGEPVRYDGNHKRHRFLTDVLSTYVDYLPVCPEAGIGMGVPRPPIQLVGRPGKIRAVGVENSGLDVTADLENYARQQQHKLAGISGYIFKKNSPSCGLGKVKLFETSNHGMQRKGTGIFADTLVGTMPLLPVAEEDCFDAPDKRSHFLEQVYTFHRWQTMIASGLTRERLCEFHTNHKYLVMVHSEAACLRLENLLDEFADNALTAVSESYLSGLMQALKRTPQKRQRLKVLAHIISDLRKTADPAEQPALASQLQLQLKETRDIPFITRELSALISKDPQSGHAARLFLHPYPESLQDKVWHDS